MIKKINREKIPMRLKIFSGDWDRGIIIGNVIIFTGKFRKEVKQIEKFYQHNNDTHGFYVQYKGEPSVLHVIYIRD